MSVGDRRSQLQRVAELVHLVAFGWLVALVVVGVPLAVLAGSIRFDVTLAVCFAVSAGCNLVLGELS